ncbi:FYVE, RhoGEF and PH domain-containing protein 6-like [Oopsacas minuta]|uniref:FYVE, RhoGEF and PH domain-containing protein 6-like n=1 Tax=Oopsacas minuta TaxID=111878 RepID=A0AAV7JD18_9METZ|nr:FYVE, RhoGEF and PH domain-containing protein 6-like [Oopsacas minuta]
MSATHSPIIPNNRNSPPLPYPPKTNGSCSSPLLPTHLNTNKKTPPIPTKPKPPLSLRRSHVSQRLSGEKRFPATDSSPESSPQPVLKPIPITKKYSLDSITIPKTDLPSMMHTPLSPTRSAYNLNTAPNTTVLPPALKPKPTSLTPSSSPISFRKINSEAALATHKARLDSPVIAPKPLFPNSHKYSTSNSPGPYTTSNDTNSEDSGIFISPDKTLPELPPKLPVRPIKNTIQKPTPVTSIILVPKIERREQRWTTNTSDIPMPPPLPDKHTPVEDKTRSSSEADTLDTERTKLFRTMPSRGTKKKRPNLKHHTDVYTKPGTPPPVSKSTDESLHCNQLQIHPRADLNLSHSFDSLDSEEHHSVDTLGRKSDSTSNIPKKISSGSNEVKSGKMKRALLKALGVGKKERNSELDISTSLSSSISSPALSNEIPNLSSTQSVPARVSRALNMKSSVDDSCVFENVSDTEADPDPGLLPKSSYDPSLQVSTELTSSPVRHRSPKSPKKRSFNSNFPVPPHFQNTDFQYVFENEDSDTDSLSDVEAFDDFDEILNDSDNEMTEEDVDKAKMRTIARAASGITYSKCYYVAKEILSTEETYVRKLRLLHIDFSEALEEASKRNGKPILTEDVLKKIFSNLPVLYQINSTFRDELKERLEIWSKSSNNQNIGDIMKRHAHFFKAYSPFIANFDSSLKILEELTKKNSSFGQFLSLFQSLPKCSSLPVSAHLLGIVQRIPRYKLLLEQYIKHLPEDSTDGEDSEKALALITEVAVHVNENLRQMDNFKKMVDVLNKIDGDVANLFVEPRQFVKGGELKKVCRKGQQMRAFFLFTDVLLHTSLPGPGSSNYSLHTRIPLAGMKVAEHEQADDLSENDPLKHSFKIISAIRSFVVVPSSQEEKEEWLSVLNKTLSELQDKMISHAKTNNRTSIFVEPSLLDNSDAALGSLAPVWIQDDSVSMCMMCYNKFTFARRRHHCRVCGKVLCGPCSSFKAGIKYLGNKQARCCLSCYEKLTNVEDVTEEIDPVASVSENPDTSSKKKRTRLRKERSLVPSHLLQATSSEVDYQMRGNLEYNESSSTRFKNSRWVVLQDSVLFIFKKREDTAAIQTVPILGYSIDTISDTVFALSHRNVQNRFFKADCKETADKWKKELSRILDVTLPDSAVEIDPYSTIQIVDTKSFSLRTRSATTGHVSSTLCESEASRSQQTQSSDYSTKSLSTGGVTCIDTTKYTDPLSPTDSVIEDDVSTEKNDKEDLTETITEDKVIENND